MKQYLIPFGCYAKKSSSPLRKWRNLNSWEIEIIIYWCREKKNCATTVDNSGESSRMVKKREKKIGKKEEKEGNQEIKRIDCHATYSPTSWYNDHKYWKWGLYSVPSKSNLEIASHGVIIRDEEDSMKEYTTDILQNVHADKLPSKYLSLSLSKRHLSALVRQLSLGNGFWSMWRLIDGLSTED